MADISEIDQLIDKNLPRIKAAKEFTVHDFHLENDKPMKNIGQPYNSLIRALEQHDLIEPLIAKGDIVRLTPTAESILTAGGWLAYINHVRDEKLRIQTLENTKLKLEVTLLKWQRAIFWPIFIVGLFGGIYSAVQFYKDVTGDKRQEAQSEERTIDKPVLAPDTVRQVPRSPVIADSLYMLE